jgi:hypothetical protein
MDDGSGELVSVRGERHTARQIDLGDCRVHLVGRWGLRAVEELDFHEARQCADRVGLGLATVVGSRLQDRVSDGSRVGVGQHMIVAQ